MSEGLEDVPSSTTETLTKLLSEIQSLNQEKRVAAQKAIKALEVTDEFGIDLAEILVDPEEELAIRLLASTALQRYIETHWQNLSNEEFEYPEIKLESKEKIKEILPCGLRESTIEIRTAVAHTISAIAYWNWPENWPGLYDVLVDCLSGESNFAVHEVMQVLRICIQYISNTQLPNIGSVILQAMYQIFHSETQYSVMIRSQAVEILTTILSFLAIPDYCETDFIRQSIQPVIPMFCEKFMQTLGDKSQSTINEHLKTEAVKAITMLTAMLPKCIFDFLPQIMPLMWEILADSAEAYQEHTVNEEEDIDDENVDSNAEEMNDCDTLINAIFEFIGVLISGRNGYKPILSEYDLSNYQWFQLQDTKSLPPGTIRHLMNFMELTNEQISIWTNNPSQFLIEGEMDVNPNHIRGLARDLLIKIIDQKGVAAHALVGVILNQIQAEDALRISGDYKSTENSWKSHEALLLAFCIAKNIIVDKQTVKHFNFAIAAFLENVVLADLNNSESHPLLVSRCLRLGEIYADEIPPKMMSGFLKATGNGLVNRRQCVKICAAIAASCWLREASIEENSNGNTNILRSQLPAMFEGLFDLGSNLMTAEGLKLVLDSFAIVVSLDKTFTASVKIKICTLTITTFHNFYNDLSILRVCEKIFRELTLHSECIEELQARLVPQLVEMMTVNPSDNPENGKVALDTVQILVEHSPQPLSSLLIESAFPASCKCILSSDNHATLQSGGKVIRTYVSLAFQQVIGYKDNDNKTGFQYMFQIAAQFLKPRSSDFRIQDACEIIESLIKEPGPELRVDTTIQELITLVLRKMQCAERRIFMGKLLMVFALLINTQSDIVLKFLFTAPESEGQSNLAFIVSDGFCKEHQYFAPDDRKIVNLALSKILQHHLTLHKSDLHRGAPQDTEDTRTTNPVLVEICKLVSLELSQ